MAASQAIPRPEKMDTSWYKDPQVAVPSGKLSHNYHNYGKITHESTISMAMFNSYFDITRGYMSFSKKK